ncbi:hypothetical protein Tco_0115880 [Tanacetum coccineum]
MMLMLAPKSAKALLKSNLPIEQVVNIFKLLRCLGWRAIPLDKGFFEEILGINSSWGESVHPSLCRSGGILLRLEAFVASPIGCEGSDVEMTE